MRKPHPRILLVEGKEDQRVIPQFMEKFIPWGERNEREKWPADIVEFDGVEPLLEIGVIEAELKSPGLEALGVMLDANSDPVGRWNRIRARAVATMPAIPLDLPIWWARAWRMMRRASVRRLADAGLLFKRNDGNLPRLVYRWPTGRALGISEGSLYGGENKVLGAI